MPFALGLLDNSDALDILPMQSLCELLLYDSNEWQDKQVGDCFSFSPVSL